MYVVKLDGGDEENERGTRRLREVVINEYQLRLDVQHFFRPLYYIKITGIYLHKSSILIGNLLYYNYAGPLILILGCK